MNNDKNGTAGRPKGLMHYSLMFQIIRHMLYVIYDV